MRRLHVLHALVLITMAILGSRLYQLQLVEAEAARYRNTTNVFSMRQVYVTPLRGQIFAADGTTVLARSDPAFALALRPGSLPPDGSAGRAELFARLSSLAGLTATLTLSPTTALAQRPALADQLRAALDTPGPLPAARADDPLRLDMPVPPSRVIPALHLSQVYSDVLTLLTPVQQRVDTQSIPAYQTLTIAEDIPRDLALVVRENASRLPGVVVLEDYRRSYPFSAEVPSLSHLLGHIGRVNQCELVAENPTGSWLDALLGTLGSAVPCGLQPTTLSPADLGVTRYLNDDRIGKDGLEASFEAVLRGQLGIDQLRVDALNRPIGASQTMRPAHDGDNLVLSIDLPFQRQVEQILRRWLAEAERRRQAIPPSGPFVYKRSYDPIMRGVAIVLDVRTGRVLAMVSLPAFDNNIWVDPQRDAELAALLNPDPATASLAPLTNRAIAGQYPAGSTLKQFVAAAALQFGVIDANTRVRDPNRLIIEDEFTPGVLYPFPNATTTDNGQITVSDALRVSSNVFFFTVAGGNDRQVVNLGPRDWRTSGLQITRLAEGLSWFGLGERTGIPLPFELRGRVPDPAWKARELREAWTLGDTYNTAIGQGNLLVTPLQLALASSAVANGGTIYRPQLVTAITDSNGNVIRTIAPEALRQVPVDPAHLAVVREGMRRSVTDGANVAARFECSGLQIAGKTGTAEFGPVINVPSADGRTVRQVRQSHAWFAGFAPYDNPQIEVLVLIEGAGDLGDGSATLAVPAVTQIMQAYFGVTPPDPAPRGCPVMPQDTP